MENPQWHALLVRRSFERTVALHLKKERIEHYLPIVRLEWRSDAGIQSTEFPLFPRYVFCKCDSPSLDLTIPGVLTMWGGQNHIQAVSEREIADLRRILAAGLEVQRWPFTSQGKMAAIEEGSLSGVTGILGERPGERMFVVSIQLIRQSLALNVDDIPRISVLVQTLNHKQVSVEAKAIGRHGVLLLGLR